MEKNHFRKKNRFSQDQNQKRIQSEFGFKPEF